MADHERDLVDGGLQISLIDDDTDSLALADCAISDGKIDLDGSSGQKDEEWLTQSTAINAAETGPHISEGNFQYDDRQFHQPVPDPKDQGKTPVRASPYTFDKSLPDSGGVSDPNLQSQVHVRSPPSILKNLGAPKLPVTSNIEALNRESFGGPLLEICDQHRTRPSSSESISGILDVELEDENLRAESPKPCIIGQQFQEQEQKAEPVHKSWPEPDNPASTTTNQNTSEGSEAQPFRPPQYGELGWEKSADRPPKKLPIRFVDCLRREYVFPWEKAKTWAGMERLIRNCFLHTVHITLRVADVNAGHYRLLTTSLPSSMPTDFGTAIGPNAATAETEISNGPPTPPPVAPSTPAQQDPAIIILPELWEDIIEPGMTILMRMLPMNLPPAPAPPLHPPSPPMVPGLVGGRGRGQGRGRGIGRGGGRGMIVPPPFVPPGWAVIEPPKPKPRGKTRKRQDGL